MNRNRYRLVFNATVGMMVPLAETARGRGKSASGVSLAGVLLAAVALSPPAQAELPVASTGGAIPNFVTAGQAGYQVNGNQAFVNQVGDKAILNWKSFNVSAGSNVRFQQVDGLASNNLVPGANFTSLNRIWDNNPSVIAGSLSQGAGQKGNVILVNSNGIAFMGGSQVNLNSFTASTLNIADSFILDTLLTTDGQPQFEKALDGGEGRGFVKVFENAKISAGSQGRVMLIAPTVVNKGKVEASDGQVVVAAGTKVFLRTASAFGDSNVRGLLVEVDSPVDLNDFDTANTGVKDGVLDGDTVALKDAALDKLGHATNLGELSTPRGNVTMVGYAVNQMGIARATTSVVANGSVYLLAKDRQVIPSAASLKDPGSRSSRAGRVILGTGSLTEVLPESRDTATSLDGDTGTGLAAQSLVKILGQDVRLAAGSTVRVPAGRVDITAVDRPLDIDGVAGINPFGVANTAISSTARVHIADGAIIDVSGLEGVQLSAARNTVEVELRGDELKDSPVNRSGALRGEKVYVDVERALARANAGESTLIAKDSLESYQARLGRTVDERSTIGGTVNIQSQGEVILESGATIDLSGGSVDYTPAMVKSTLLFANGKRVDVSDADGGTRYDGITTRFTVDYTRWNVKETFDLGENMRYDTGYTEGKSAGALNIVGMGGTVLQASVQGRTTIGELQRSSLQGPQGAQLRVGSGSVDGDFKNFQQVRIGHAFQQLPISFNFGDVLPEAFKTSLNIDTSMFGNNLLAGIEIYSNKDAVVEQAIRMPEGGSVSITASAVQVNADISAAGGRIVLNARDNQVGPFDLAAADTVVADGVRLSTAGRWTNERVGFDDPARMGVTLDGGVITVAALNDVVIGQGAGLDVSAGAWLQRDGALVVGSGGAITVEANKGVKTDQVANGRTVLDGGLRGFGGKQGGSLAISSGTVQMGGVASTAENALNLSPDLLVSGGFEQITITGREGLTVADGLVLAPQLKTLELLPDYVLQRSGADIAAFSTVEEKSLSERTAVNLTLAADSLLLGDVHLGVDSRVTLDPGGEMVVNAAHQIDLLGTIKAPGGRIAANLSGSLEKAFDPTSSIWLGERARLDASGQAVTYTAANGLPTGQVLNGGAVELTATTGYVIAKTGSTVDVSGVAPVFLGDLNETGGIGRMVGSGAGSITVAAREGMALDGNLVAQPGAVGLYGGALSVSLGRDAIPLVGLKFPVAPSVLSLEASVPTMAETLIEGQAIPDTLNGVARLGADRLEAAGFDQIALSGKDAIRLENGLDIGAARTLPLRLVSLDAPRIETAGGDAAITASLVRFGNQDVNRQGVLNTPVAGSGELTVNADRIDLVGKHVLSGMGSTVLNAKGQIELSGVVVTETAAAAGVLATAGDLRLSASVVTPASYSDFKISAPNRLVQLQRNTDDPQQPLSAYGRLRVEAANIVQGGNVWAPLGQVALAASGTLTLTPGSLTSVSAEAGSVLPFGTVANGRSWTYASKVILTDLPEKSVRLEGDQVDFQKGATVSVAGGGNAQAYEFTVGPGGSSDVLATPGTYAVMAGYTGGFAPTDRQESFDQSPGATVYLAGINGLADGNYTLLPAHYALLPGAYAVRVDPSKASVLPGNGYIQPDGVQVVAGYLSDGRASAPRTDWQGIQVLTQAQVRDRSEFTLTQASAFFADSRFAPQDAGRLAVQTTGTANNSLILEGTVLTKGAAGGSGASVDIGARNLAVVGSAASVVGSSDSVVKAEWLNALKAESLLLGGERSTTAGVTTLVVSADNVTIANDSASSLVLPEIIVAAKDTVRLKTGSSLSGTDQGTAEASSYITAGNGALVRVASTGASFSRTGSPNRTAGKLIGEVGSQLAASDSAVLDAAQETTFAGGLKLGSATQRGHLQVGASRIGFGDVPSAVGGLKYNQTELNKLAELESLTLTSYSTLDVYGDVQVGSASLGRLALEGGGIVGFAGADTAAAGPAILAKNITLSNRAGAGYQTDVNSGLVGQSALSIEAGEQLTLGAGAKQIKGFSAVNLTSASVVGSGAGETRSDAPVTLTTTRISGETGAEQSLVTSGKLTTVYKAPASALADVQGLGAKWSFEGDSVAFAARVELPAGAVSIKATEGDLQLAEGAIIDVKGQTVAFFDTSETAAAGKVLLVSSKRNVDVATGARIDVSAAPGGDAGRVVIEATQGTVSVAAGSLKGEAPEDGDKVTGTGARFSVDAKQWAVNEDFSKLNAVLNAGGFTQERSVRVRAGGIQVSSTDVVTAHRINLSADTGQVAVAGKLDANGADGGQVGLYGKSVVLTGTGRIEAKATAVGGAGGRVEIGAATEAVESTGTFDRATAVITRGIDLQAGGVIDVSAGIGGEDGEVHLRAQRQGTDVAVKQLASTITGAREVTLEAVRVYDGKSTLNASTTDSGVTLGLTKIKNDNNAYASNYSTIKNDVGQSGNADFHVVSGVEVRSAGDMTLGADGADWNFNDATAGGEAGVLTLRAGGNLNINNNLSDGFSHATANTTPTGTTPASLLANTLRGGRSWSYNLVAGADSNSANVLDTKVVTGNLTVAAGKLVRTGTGDIRMAAGSNIALASNTTAVYTAGKAFTPDAGFLVPGSAQFSHGGGDVEMVAKGNITGVASAQLYSNWLYRQGSLKADGESYKLQPAWWVRFDKFQQGVATLGGGNVTLTAGGNVANLSASAATQGYTTSATVDPSAAVRIGGGDVRVTAEGDILSGQYYADRGDVNLHAGGSIKSGYTASSKPVHTVLAVGDGIISATAGKNVDVYSVLNPHLIVQSSGTGGNIGNTQALNAQWSLFSTYTEDSAVSLQSVTGNVRLFGAGVISGNSAAAALSDAYKTPVNLAQTSYNKDLLSVLPPSLSAVALSGNVSVASDIVLSPGAQSDLRILAAQDVVVPARITMSDTAPLPDAVQPSPTGADFTKAISTQAALAHDVVPVHTGDADPVRVYAVEGSVLGAGRVLKTPKLIRIRAGQDIEDLPVDIQHVAATDVSIIEAGHDIAFTTVSGSRSPTSYVAVSGPGRLEMTAGHDIDLGASAGVLSRGALDNPALPDGGADLHLSAGVGAAGLDYQGAANRLATELSSDGFSEQTLWLARWLTGDVALSRGDALSRVQQVAAAAPETVRTRVREMLFTGILQAGRESNIATSPFAGDFGRAYQALETVFPGMGDSAATGKYQGMIDIFASRIKTEQGGDIELLVPGGGIVVGLSNTPAALVTTPKLGKDAGPLGIVTVGAGNIRVAARDDVLVNQSRILTAAGGDILIWSSEGDIDAGKGKKTATAVPPPVIKVDATGSVTQEIQAAASGSGIGALKTGDLEAGDVDLVAPKGTVNAGDAGIRAGNLNIAALVVLGADNITVSGTSAGTPVADTSAVTASASGATTAGGDVSSTLAAMNQSATDSARSAQALSDSFKPSFVRVDVLGFGE